MFRIPLLAVFYLSCLSKIIIKMLAILLDKLKRIAYIIYVRAENN